MPYTRQGLVMRGEYYENKIEFVIGLIQIGYSRTIIYDVTHNKKEYQSYRLYLSHNQNHNIANYNYQSHIFLSINRKY